MVHCKPAELLLPEQGLTKPTERMLNYFSGWVLAPDHGRKANANAPTGVPQQKADFE
jgi:hypothetical protein